MVRAKRAVMRRYVQDEVNQEEESEQNAMLLLLKSLKFVGYT